MNFKHYTLNEINPVKWDEHVYNSQLGNIFQTYDFALVMNSSGDQPYFIEWQDNSGNEVKWLLLKRKKNNSKITKLFWSYFLWNHGHPITENKDVPSTFPPKEFYTLMKREKISQALILPIYPLLNCSLLEKDFSSETIYTFIVDLEKPSDELWQNLEGRKKRGVKKANKAGVIIKKAENINQMDQFYELVLQTCKRANISFCEPISFYQDIWNVLVSKGKADLLLAMYNDKIISGIIVLKDNPTKRLYYWKGASDTEFRNLQATTLLLWKTIKLGHEMKYKTFDMFHYMPPGKSSNLRLFKKGWGGSEIQLCQYTGEVPLYKYARKVKNSFFPR